MENYERNPETYVSRKILKKSKKALKNGTEDTQDIHENAGDNFCILRSCNFIIV